MVMWIPRNPQTRHVSFPDPHVCCTTLRDLDFWSIGLPVLGKPCKSLDRNEQYGRMPGLCGAQGKITQLQTGEVRSVTIIPMAPRVGLLKRSGTSPSTIAVLTCST